MTNEEIEKRAVEKTLEILKDFNSKSDKEKLETCVSKIFTTTHNLELAQCKLFGKDFLAMTSFFRLCDKHFPDKFKSLTDHEKIYLGIIAISLAAGKMADMVLGLNKMAEQMHTQEQINSITQKISKK